MYFDNITTLDEAKNLFRTLCLKLHPDTSGSDTGTEFIRMYNEFKRFVPTNGKNDATFEASKFYDMLKKFDSLKDIKINFIGSFIWFEDIIQGATYKQREVLKSIIIDGFNTVRYAPKKKLWYFSPIDYVQKSKGIADLEVIKNKYGNESFNLKGLSQITA